MPLRKPLTIFVVEDDLMYQSLIKKSLESFTDDVHSYTSCENCLSEMDKSPSVIVMDYMLEGKMNGLDAIKKIKNINPSVHVILFSMENDLGTSENKEQYGSFDFIKKNVYAFPLLKKVIFSSLSQTRS